MTTPISNDRYVKFQDNGDGIVGQGDTLVVKGSDNKERTLDYGSSEAISFLTGLGASGVAGMTTTRARIYLGIHSALDEAGRLTTSGDPSTLITLYGYVTDGKDAADNLVLYKGPDLRRTAMETGSAILRNALDHALQQAETAAAGGDQAKAAEWVKEAKTLARYSTQAGYDVSWDAYEKRAQALLA